MRTNQPQIDSGEISTFCKRHHIKKLSLFGSVLRSDFDEMSDVDVLVEFDPTHTPGLIRFSAMERELAELFGRRVDLRTPQDLSLYFRDQVLTTARVQYAE